MRRFMMTVAGTAVVVGSSMFAVGQDKAPVAVQAPVQAPAKAVQAPAPVQAPVQAPKAVQAPMVPVQKPVQAPIQKHSVAQVQSPVQKGAVQAPLKTAARGGLCARNR